MGEVEPTVEPISIITSRRTNFSPEKGFSEKGHVAGSQWPSGNKSCHSESQEYFITIYAIYMGNSRDVDV